MDRWHALLNKLKQYSYIDKIRICFFVFSLLVVHCPALKPPENGFFIQNTCKNHFNAACGVRCRPGFDLVGSSIHLCQPNGLWSGTESFCRGMRSGQFMSFPGCLVQLPQLRVSWAGQLFVPTPKKGKTVRKVENRQVGLTPSLPTLPFIVF